MFQSPPTSTIHTMYPKQLWIKSVAIHPTATAPFLGFSSFNITSCCTFLELHPSGKQHLLLIYIYTYGNYISIYGFQNIRTGIFDYLWEGFPWPARPFKHTESNSFKHTVTTFKYTNWNFVLPPGPLGLARPPYV